MPIDQNQPVDLKRLADMREDLAVPILIAEVERLRVENKRLNAIEVAAAELGAAMRTGEQCHEAEDYVDHIAPALASVAEALVFGG